MYYILNFLNKKWWLQFKTTKEIPRWHKPETLVNNPCDILIDTTLHLLYYILQYNMHHPADIFWEHKCFTGKSFSEANKFCRTCCVPKLFWMSKQKQQFVYTTRSAGILSLQFSWTVNNLLLYCWCKNKSFLKRFTCTVFFEDEAKLKTPSEIFQHLHDSVIHRMYWIRVCFYV